MFPDSKLFNLSGMQEYMTRNTYIYPPGPSLRIISDIMGFCSTDMPK